MWDVPEHFPIDVNANGEGPAEPHERVRTVCWCPLGDRCPVIPPTPAYGWAGATVGSPPMTDTTEDAICESVEVEEIRPDEPDTSLPLTDHWLNTYREALSVSVVRVDDDGPVHNGITLHEVLDDLPGGPHHPSELTVALLGEVARLRDVSDALVELAYQREEQYLRSYMHGQVGRGDIHDGAKVRIADGQDPDRVYNVVDTVRANGARFASLEELEGALVLASRLIVVG